MGILWYCIAKVVLRNCRNLTGQNLKKIKKQIRYETAQNLGKIKIKVYTSNLCVSYSPYCVYELGIISRGV